MFLDVEVVATVVGGLFTSVVNVFGVIDITLNNVSFVFDIGKINSLILLFDTNSGGNAVDSIDGNGFGKISATPLVNTYKTTGTGYPYFCSLFTISTFNIISILL